jgi:hypothetical protein
LMSDSVPCALRCWVPSACLFGMTEEYLAFSRLSRSRM